MSAARGDRRPCLFEGCSGEMQYGRRSDQDGEAAHAPGAPRDEREGWLCSQSVEHFIGSLSAAERASLSDHRRP